MKNIYAIKAELDGLQGLKELTESLNYMSAAKMMKVREKVLKTRTFLEEALNARVELQRYIFKRNKGKKIKKGKMTGLQSDLTLVIAIMTDQGLCGAFNSQLAKSILKDMKGKEITLAIIGKKGVSYFARTSFAKKMKLFKLPTKDTNTELKDLFNMVEDYGTVYIYFNKYINAVKTDPVGYLYKSMAEKENIKQLAKLDITEQTIHLDEISKTFIVEPNIDEVNNYFDAVISQAVFMHQMLESQLSENNARMLAMKEASDNIVEMITKQRKVLNLTRRTKINQSLSELFGALIINH